MAWAGVLAREVLKLFVDNVALAGGTVAWILAIAVIARALPLGVALPAVFFAGLLLLLSVTTYTRAQKLRRSN